jgi:hypothetical protein
MRRKRPCSRGAFSFAAELLLKTPSKANAGGFGKEKIP